MTAAPIEEVMVNGRWPLMLPKHRADRESWPWWEATRLAAMRTVIGPGSVVYDVGAEEGDFPALWASWGAEVVLAEPNERVWPNIALIWAENYLAQPLFCWPGFIGEMSTWDAHDAVGGQLWPDCADGEVIGDHGFCRIEERPDIPVLAIDDLAAIVKPPTVITMDVEGAEFLVLAGATETLARYRSEVFVSVHPEFMAHHYGIDDGLGLIDSMMTDAGYELTPLCTDHEVHQWWRPT